MNNTAGFVNKTKPGGKDMENNMKDEKEDTHQNNQAEERIRKAIRIEANAVARRWFIGLFLICCVATLSSVFVLYMYSIQSHAPAESLSPIPENSAKYLKDRVDDLAESQKWVLLIFGGLAAFITLLGASSQWLQYTEGRREREVKEPGQQTMMHQVNEVIETVRKTLDFRLREEKELLKAKETLKKLENRVDVLRVEAKEVFDQLKNQLTALTLWPRITFTSLDPRQEAFSKRFLQQFSVLPKWFRMEHQKDLDMGQVTYFAGVIAFVNNDIAYSMNLLEEAKICRDENLKSEDEQLQFWGAFVTYWMGLVEKNWGKLDKAKGYFDDSLSRFGPQGKKKKKNEWLTRLSFAEILMFDHTTRKRARNEVEEVLKEIGEITKDTRTETKKMWVRAKLLNANGEMADGNVERAKNYFEEVLHIFPDNYYASFSYALCLRKLATDVESAKEEFARTFKLIQDSGDLKTKKELGPLAGLNYVTMRSAQWSGKEEFTQEYKRLLYELLDPNNTIFNNFQLRIFIPDKSRMMLAEEIRADLEEI